MTKVKSNYVWSFVVKENASILVEEKGNWKDGKRGTLTPLSLERDKTLELLDPSSTRMEKQLQQLR